MANEVSWEERIELTYEKYKDTIKNYNHFKRWMIQRKEVGYNIDMAMIVKCYNIHHRITTMNDDHFLVTVGMEGVGKTTYIMNVCSMVDPTFNCSRICYTLKQFLDFVKVCNPGEAVLIDEGGSVLYSRQAMSQRNVGLTKLFSIIRQKNLFIGIAIPNFFVLDSYVRMHRVNSLVNIEERGTYRLVSDALNRVSITKLNKEGSASRDVANVKPVPGTAFRGHFSKSLPGNIDEEEYLIRKAEHMDEIVDELNDLDDEVSISKYVKLKEVAEKIGCDRKTVNNMINDGRLEGKKIGSNWFVTREIFEKL